MLSLDAAPTAGADTASQVSQVVPLGWFGQRSYWTAVALFAWLVVAVIALLTVLDPASRAAVSGLGQTLAALLALIASIVVSRRVRDRRARLAWQVMALAQAFYVVGNAVVIALSTSDPTSASFLSGWIFLAFYLSLAAGILTLPTVTTTAARQVRLVLDVFIVIGALLGPALVFLVIPRFVAVQADFGFFPIAYPFADLTLVLVAAIQLVRGVQQAYRPAFFWVMIGSVSFVYADLAFNYVTLPAPGQTATVSFGIAWIDPMWVLGLLCFCLAPLALLVTGGATSTWGWLEHLALRVGKLRASQAVAQFGVLAFPVLLLFGMLLLALSDARRTEAAIPLVVLSVLVVLLIIIRQLLTQRDLVDARIATERAAQLDELKDQFITSVNHELRTPLMTMVGGWEILVQSGGQVPPERVREINQRSLHAGKQLIRLVNSILDTRRIDQEARDLVPEVVHLATAAQTALTLIDPGEADPTARTIALRIPAALAVWGDPVRVQQILTNLMSNAIKYSPAGTPVLVSAALTPEQTGRLVGGRSGHRMVEITVQDQGLGIPPAQKDLLFRRFVRLPRDIASTTRGTGLGLYLCRVFVEAMQGSIWVESSGIPGEGATFHVRLPLPPASAPADVRQPLLAGTRP
jgi:signal transduction histidine kinase